MRYLRGGWEVAVERAIGVREQEPREVVGAEALLRIGSAVRRRGALLDELVLHRVHAEQRDE